MRRFRTVSLIAGFATLALVGLACKQGNGQRCELASDCDDGLICNNGTGAGSNGTCGPPQGTTTGTGGQGGAAGSGAGTGGDSGGAGTGGGTAGTGGGGGGAAGTGGGGGTGGGAGGAGGGAGTGGGGAGGTGGQTTDASVDAPVD